MPARARLALMAAASLVLAGALAFVLLWEPDRGVQAPAHGFAGALQPAAPAHDFALRDQDGEVVTLRSLRGEVAVVTFLYTTCEDTCPVAASQIRGALDILGADVPVLAVSVDPARDTPLNAKRFLARRHLTGRMRFLLGSTNQLAPVWRAYGIRPQGGGFEHTAHVLVLDRRGRRRVGFPVDKLTPEGLAHDLRRLRAE